MRALPLLLLLLLPLSCKPGDKTPAAAATGTKERIQQLGADLRAYVARTYPGCTLGSAVSFDGKSVYTGRAFHTPPEGEPTRLNFLWDGKSWQCVDTDSSAPGSTTPCQSTLEACK